MDELSDHQTVDIVEQLWGNGFEWGLSSKVNVTGPKEPCTFAEAMAAPDTPKWLACNEELPSIKELGVFRLIPKSTADGQTIMDRKFIFRLKQNEKEDPVHWKARYVAKGYSAIYSIDYTETTAPTM
jgi:hypothetical protein